MNYQNKDIQFGEGVKELQAIEVKGRALKVWNKLQWLFIIIGAFYTLSLIVDAVKVF